MCIRDRRKLALLSMEQLKQRIPELVSSAKDLNGVKVVFDSIGAIESPEQVREIAIALRDKLESDSAVVAIAGEAAGKIVLIIATSKKARDAGISSGKLVKEASAILGGGGGGKDDVAQGGGPNTKELAKAFATLEKSVSN